mmetsp:Transcript_18262/g.51152  ORF Transcript_18262/g.51152 Transcript_18262/m.51152 type:complete len:544 (-) Transcript_18262:303-1934(-)
MVTMQACNHQNLKCVPLYDTLGHDAVEFIMKHSEAAGVFCQGPKLKVLSGALQSVKSNIKLVCFWGEASDADKKAMADAGFTLKSFDDLLAEGAAKPVEPLPCSSDDLCTIMYTSGTTGDPKGVMMKHSNVLAEIAAAKAYMDKVCHYTVGPGDSFLSYLPLAHIFDRAIEEFFLECGGSIGYYRGDVKLVVEDITALKPTLFCGVPRVFDRIYTGVMAKMKAAGWVKSQLFNWAYNRKKEFMKRGYTQEKASPFFDKLVFSKIKEALGGRVQLIVSGAAPLSVHVEEFLKIAMMCNVVQGYGLTETMAGTTIGLPGSMGGNVGPPLAGISIRLESVPDMNYDALSNPPRGEVCIKGPTVFDGYYKRDDLTKEAKDADGWFHTGDIGEIIEAGNLKIIDRKKNIFKLSQGEYIAVEKVESTLKKFEMLEQIWVYGNSYESVLVAVAVPLEPKLMAWAKENKIEGDFKALCSNDQVKKMVVDGLNAVGRADKLKGFELVKAVHLDTESFDVERDLMTPTFKLKRPQLLKYYQKHVDEMYASLKK